MAPSLPFARRAFVPQNDPPCISFCLFNFNLFVSKPLNQPLTFFHLCSFLWVPTPPGSRLRSNPSASPIPPFFIYLGAEPFFTRFGIYTPLLPPGMKCFGPHPPAVAALPGDPAVCSKNDLHGAFFLRSPPPSNPLRSALWSRCSFWMFPWFFFGAPLFCPSLHCLLFRNFFEATQRVWS